MVPIAAHSSSVPAAYRDHYKSYDENASGVPVNNADNMNAFFGGIDANPQDPRVCMYSFDRVICWGGGVRGIYV